VAEYLPCCFMEIVGNGFSHLSAGSGYDSANCNDSD
jgi:hypothetical protein